ncbi:MAG: RNA polymerase sigma factor [Patescibacteria group bacterium]
MENIDENKFIELYQEHAPKLFKYCYFRVNSKEDAEDLAGQVFMKTWDYLAQGNQIENMRAFLYRSAHNVIVDFYKTSKKDREISIHGFGEDTIDIPDTSDLAGDVETKSLVRDVIAKLEVLPDAYREIIVLRFINELSINEIAETTGMTENNVSVKLHRAMEKLKDITKQL